MLLRTHSVVETIRLGRRLGSLLRPGDVVALIGELGTGKTHFIKGLASGLGVRRPAHVASPSFTLVQEHPGRIPFYHVDLFRLRSEEEARELGLEDYLYGHGVTAIEWADKIPSLLPSEVLRIELRYKAKNERSVEIVAVGKRYADLVQMLSPQP